MDKKFNFQEQPLKAKIIYGVVAGVLCITAIVIGIVSSASRKNETPDENTPPPVVDETPDETPKEETPKEETPKKLTFVSPLVGKVNAYHSVDTPVFSATLGEWRVHKGIDITSDESAEVFAAESGTVSRVYNDALLGKTVEITHDGGIVTKYSNLATNVSVKEGDKVESGALIGTIGDSSISELAEEPHLHFEMLVNGVSVNPLDYISEDSREVSLGISES
ncbi:MAG: peptidoglycan DD-metalloendopeptidase family protein [Clostridia bacterium]|nr:peptidoglycan DD-metalloendopeptidase family protein [Clostridia bacterium]